MVAIVRSWVVFLVLAPLASSQSTTRMSLSTAGAQGNLHSEYPVISADGSAVAFHSWASNLVSGDTNALGDVFVRQRLTGETARVSVSSTGAQGNYPSEHPALSGDGRFVAFHSRASTLVPGVPERISDVFVHDRQTGLTSIVSVDSAGVRGNRASEFASLSGDGRLVAFQSVATNLVAGDTNGVSDVFVHDRQTGQTMRVSLDSSGAEGNGDSSDACLSADGLFVAFASESSNLVAGDTNANRDVFVHELLTGQTTRVSVDSAGGQGNSFSAAPALSGDGRRVAFASFCSNLVVPDLNPGWDVFVHDRQTGQTVLVSVDSAGVQANSGANHPSLSSDGRWVAFDSTATNLVFPDTNDTGDTFLRDLQTGQTTRVSLGSTAWQANDWTAYPSLSADGACVAFFGRASNLVPGDSNGFYDVFVRDRGLPGVLYCFGDGTRTPCPCTNDSPVGANAGCLNSLGTGAALAASGAAVRSHDTLVLSCAGMPNSIALYFQGTTQENGGSGSVFGDGLRCASGPLIRLGAKPNAGGASQYPAAGDEAISVRGLVSTPGTRTYQVWYRDAASFCTAESLNLSNGVEVLWVP